MPAEYNIGVDYPALNATKRVILIGGPGGGDAVIVNENFATLAYPALLNESVAYDIWRTSFGVWFGSYKMKPDDALQYLKATYATLRSIAAKKPEIYDKQTLQIKFCRVRRINIDTLPKNYYNLQAELTAYPDVAGFIKDFLTKNPTFSPEQLRAAVATALTFVE